MGKEVTLKINSKQYQESLVENGEALERKMELEDSVEFITEGTLYNKMKTIYLSYDESEEMGMQDAKVMLKVKPECLQIIRYGKNGEPMMDMNLEPGVTEITRYKIPMIPDIEIEVLTNKYEHSIDDNGDGYIMVDYRLSCEDFFERRNILEIEVKADN